MSEFEDLAQRAMTILGPQLPVAASKVAEAVLTGPGAKLLNWLTAKVKGTPAAETLDRAMAEPKNDRRVMALELKIEEMAEKDAAFKDELAQLLKEARTSTETISSTQVMDQSGDENKGAQVTGTRNTVQIS